jgi:hypothetical protein
MMTVERNMQDITRFDTTHHHHHVWQVSGLQRKKELPLLSISFCLVFFHEYS